MSKTKTLLTILIATVKERQNTFNELINELHRQIDEYQLEDKVEICYYQDNKEITIGHKRNMLLDMAHGEYIVFIDDDDMINEFYLPIIVKALEENPGVDCLGYKIKMFVNGVFDCYCEHSLKHAKVGWTTVQNPVNDIKYLRAVTHFNVVKLRLANMIRFNNVRYGEDRIYSDRLTEVCKKEYYIDVPYMFEYRYSSTVPHDKKYGIK